MEILSEISLFCKKKIHPEVGWNFLLPSCPPGNLLSISCYLSAGSSSNCSIERSSREATGELKFWFSRWEKSTFLGQGHFSLEWLSNKKPLTSSSLEDYIVPTRAKLSTRQDFLSINSIQPTYATSWAFKTTWSLVLSLSHSAPVVPRNALSGGPYCINNGQSPRHL